MSSRIPRVFLDAKERNELTEVVHQQAVYMSRIVADLLLLARSSTGLQLRETEVKLEKLIASTLKSIPESKGIIEIEVEPRPCRLFRQRPAPAGGGQPGHQCRAGTAADGCSSPLRPLDPI